MFERKPNKHRTTSHPSRAAGTSRLHNGWSGTRADARGYDCGLASGRHDTMIESTVRVTMTRTAPEVPSPADAIRVAVSTVIFTLRRLPGSDAVQVVLPLVRRTRDPHEGQWALPGGWLDATEGLAAAASRTLGETTGLAPSYLEQLYAFGAVDRSPTRVVSIVYWALLRADEITDSTVENVSWFDAASLPRLAFDHKEI